MTPDQWIWMPHAGHFILGHACQFRLATCVGDYIVSTVGEYWPEESSRETLANSRGVELVGMGDERSNDYANKIGFEPVGYHRLYETMIFKAEQSKNKCCPWVIANGCELDMRGYNDPGDAMAGHLELCHKWSDKEATTNEQYLARWT